MTTWCSGCASAAAHRMMLRRLAVILGGVLLLVLSVGTAAAADIVVTGPDDGETNCTLREAVASANSDTSVGGCTAGSGADTITFDTSQSGSLITLAGEQLNLTSTLTIDGGGVIAVSGGNLSRVFNVTSSGVVTLTGLTIRNGQVSGNGGGVYNGGGAVTISASSVVSNSASGSSGGGIYNSGGDLMLSSSSVISNSASGAGGIANANGGSVTLVNSSVASNRATNAAGIYNDSGGSVTLVASSVMSNSTNNPSSGDGGGVYNTGSGSAISVTASSLVQGNRAGRFGGGIYNDSGGSVTLSASSVVSNSANSGAGGGIYNASSGSVALAASSVLSNSAGIFGGGIYNASSGSVTLAASSVMYNRVGASADGGGIYNTGIGSVISMTDSSLMQSNSARNGGGIYNANNGSVTLSASSVISNSATTAGGGIYTTGGRIVLSASSVISNSAANGGGLYQPSGTTEVTASCIVNNSATAVAYIGGTAPITATGNWWGHPSGPSGAGLGVGDSVSANVDFSGPLATPILGCTTFGDPELAIAKTVTPTLAAPGEAITYTLSFSNTGARFTRSVVLSDSVPLSVTITGVTSSTFGAGVFITQTSGAPGFAWSVSDLAVGAGAYITLTGVISADAELVGSVITNTATITTAVDAAAANNSSSAAVTVNAFCFTEYTGDNTTDFSSADAQAVRDAVAAASAGGTVKIAGYCAGVGMQDGVTQTVYISKLLTLAGGYTTTNWTASYPITQPTTLDALAGGRVIYASAALTVTNLTAQNGSWTVSGQNGGGAYFGGAATLSGVHILSNTVVNLGGGAYFAGAANTTGGSFRNNQSVNFGGGFWANASLTMSNTQVLSNTVTSVVAAAAGGVAVGSATLVGGLFQGNISNGSTGGLYANNGAMITGTRFIDNRAFAGGAGGLFLPNAGNSRIVNALFAGNYASGPGSAMQISTSGVVEIIHTTIVSPSVGGTAALNVSNGTTYITNTIISNYPIGIERTAGAVIENYNLFDGNTVNLSGAVTSGGNSITGAAAFFDTTNYTLTAASAAINRGVDAGVTADFFGDVRPQGGGFDIGYDESPFSTDVAIVKEVAQAAVTPGGAITYTLRFSNTGTGLVSNITISDSIPLSVTITGVTSSTVGVGVFTTQTSGAPDFIWTASKLAVGESGVITLTGVVAGDALPGQVITNTATIAASGDSTAGDNSSSAGLTVARLLVHPAQPGVAPNGSVTISATVTPPQAKLTVSFTIASGSGGLDNPSAQTDANGVATVLYTAGTITEVVQIEGALADAPDVRDRGIVYVAAETTAGGIATSASGVYTVGDLSPHFIQVVKTGAGTPPLGWAEFAGNPCPDAAPGSRVVSPYVDVMVDDTAGVETVVVTLKYTDTQYAAQHKLFWCSLGVWQQVTETVSIDPVQQTLVFTVNGSTTPALFQLAGTPFVGVGFVPTAATVGDFVAARQADRVQITWQTLNEIGLSGFHLYRGRDPAGPGERITGDPLPAQGAGGLQGSDYSYDDFTPLPAETPVYYWLEELHGDGTYRHGPLRVGGAGSVRVFLPAISQGAASAAADAAPVDE